MLRALSAEGGADSAPTQTFPAASAEHSHVRGGGDGVTGSQSEAWESHLTGWSGTGSEQFRVADEALVRARRDREDIDRQFMDGLRDARGAAESSVQRLRAIQANVQAARQGLGPSGDTQAGRQQYAELLQSSIAEVQSILGQSQESHGRAVTALTAAAARYGVTAL